MTLKSDTLAEKGIPLVVSTDGNCSDWVTTDISKIRLSDTGVPVTASVNVPTSAYNGDYRCVVQYTAPPAGMVQSRIEVPISISVSGGKDAPPAVITTVATTPTEAPTIKAPVQEVAPIEPPTLKAPSYEPEIPFTTYGLVIAGVLAVVFVIVMVYDIRRGKR